VQKMVHSLAVDTATHRLYAPEQQEWSPGGSDDRVRSP
jgi:hypothetical protein